MIVDPDFLDHWRTRMLVDLLGGDELAPMYVIRIWGHCQTRRADQFDVPAAGLKAICRAAHDADAFERAMVEAGFVERDGKTLRVPKWAEHNAKLIANWKNGQGGGRPKRTESKPKKNPPKTQEEPTENPSVTHSEPIREDKSREEENTPLPPSSGGSAQPERAKTSEGFEQFWAAYPRKCSKGQARKAWDKLRPSPELLHRILRSLDAAKRRDDWRKESGRFVPYPATWLNAEGWEDEPPIARIDKPWWVDAGFGNEEAAIAAGVAAEHET